VDKFISELSFEGRITDIYRDLNNHYMYTFIIDTNEGNLSFVADVFNNSWEFAEVGDSIFKKKNELYISVKKKNSEVGRFFYER
jgi:hypothetical protein